MKPALQTTFAFILWRFFAVLLILVFAQSTIAGVWDGDVVAQEVKYYADGSVATVDWHYQPGTMVPIARKDGHDLHYIVTDHIGTAKESISEDGKVLMWQRHNQVWGQKLASCANDNRIDAHYCPIGFQGQWEDEETGLSYNRFRYYDAEAGTYISSDPIGLLGGFRSYGYVGNPNGEIDPLGLCASAYMSGYGRGASGFKNFWDNASDSEFQQAWADPVQRRNIIDRLRGEGLTSPAGNHEWLPVSQANRFREMGFSFDDYMAYTQPTNGTRFIDTPAGAGNHSPNHWSGTGFGTGQNWGGSAASSYVHQQLIQAANIPNQTRAGYVQAVRDIASQHLSNGVLGLPPGMRP